MRSLVLLVAVATPCFAADNSSIPAKYIEIALQNRDEAIKGMEGYAQRLSGQKKKAKLEEAKTIRAERDRSTLGKPGAKTALQKVIEYEEVRKWVPKPFDAFKMKSGYIARFGESDGPVVVYIKDKEEMMVRWGVVFVLRGFKTKDLVDGSRVKVPGIVEVTGTAKYGGSTVYVLEPFILKGQPSDAEYKEALAQAKRLKADQKTRAAKDAEIKVAEKTIREKEKAERDNQAAALRRLKLAKSFLPDQKDKAITRLKEIVKAHPGTQGAKQAQELLDGLTK